MCGLTALKICSFSGLSSFLLRLERDIRAGMICTDDTRTFRLQAKGRRPYLSQNIGPAVAGSAGPVPPPLPKKYTSDFHNVDIVIQQIRMYLRYDVCKHNNACVQARPNYGKWSGSESPDENYTVQV